MKAIRTLLTALLALLALPAAAQTAAPAATPKPLPRVAIDTSAGRIVFELEAEKAPVTVANFLKYVDQKRLDGTVFYRVVKVQDQFGFVQFGVQGNPKRILPPIRHEPTSRTGLRHLDGTLSIARHAPGTARGEFTIMVGDQPDMDAGSGSPADNQGYAAFGRVVEGREVLVAILDGRIDPARTDRGAFRGQIPAAPVKILGARRVNP